jgi:hypothetical protein
MTAQFWTHFRAARAAGGFPDEIPDVTSCWLRFAAGVSDGNGFSAVPDALNVNPATQSINVRKPARTFSANGYTLAAFDSPGDLLVWPLISGNNQDVTTGFMFWCIPGTVTGRQVALGMSSSTLSPAVFRLSVELNDATVRCLAGLGGGSNIRAGTTANVLSIGVPVCIGVEFNGDASSEADECVITINGVAQALTFSQLSGTAADMPDALQTVTGSALIGGLTLSDSPGGPFASSIGPNLFAFNAAMPGVTSGLLTPAARLALAGFEAPTV